MAAICGITRTVLNGWDKAGLIARDPGGAYGLAETAEVALLADLRETFPLDELATLWRSMRQQGETEALIARACRVHLQPLDLVVQPDLGVITGVSTDEELLLALRRGADPRTVVLRPQTRRLTEVLEAFARFATVAKRPTKRKAGRPPAGATVRTLEGKTR